MIEKKHIGYEFSPVTVPVEEGRLKFLAKALGMTQKIYTDPDAAEAAGPVSYTHLTLPTILLV